MEQIDRCDYVVVAGTPEYRRKYDNYEPMGPYVVAAEGDLIGMRMLASEAMKAPVLPILVAGAEETSFLPLLQGRVYGDSRDSEHYLLSVFDLILSLYAIPPSDPAVADLREGLHNAIYPDSAPGH